MVSRKWILGYNRNENQGVQGAGFFCWGLCSDPLRRGYSGDIGWMDLPGTNRKTNFMGMLVKMCFHQDTEKKEAL